MRAAATLMSVPVAALLPVAAAAVAGQPAPAACVPGAGLAAPVVREDGRLFFRGDPDERRSYVARFKGGRCPGLNAMSAVSIQRNGNRYCEGDKVRALNLPGRVPGPVCILDRLEPVTGQSPAPQP